MNIPQLTSKQVEILKEMTHRFYEYNIDYTSYVVPNRGLDGDSYDGYVFGAHNAAGLCELGLLIDTTASNKEFAESLKRNSEGREWNIYSLSDLAHQMFPPYASTTIN